MTAPKSPRSGTVCMTGAKNSPPRAVGADAERAGSPAASSLKRSASLFLFARANLVFAAVNFIFPSAKIIFTDAFGLGWRHKRGENQINCLFPARKWPGQGESAAAAAEGFGPKTRIRLPAAAAGRSAARGRASGSPRNSRWCSGGWSSARRFPIPPPTRGPTPRGAARIAAR